MLGNSPEEARLEVADPKAVKPAKRVGVLKSLLRQFEATGNPPLQGEKVPTPKLVGDGNYHWYPLAWLRWLAQWERVKTGILLFILLCLVTVYGIISHRRNCQVNLPEPSTELLLKAKGFDSFNQNQAEAFVIFVLNAANQSSSEGMPNLSLLEGSIDAAIYLRLQQKGMNQQLKNLTPAEFPIYSLYISEVTRWRYNPATRIVSAYAKGFRMSHTLSGKSSMDPYRAQVEIFWEPMSNRNKWGYYVQRLDEFYGTAARAYDAELKSRDRAGT